MLHQGFVEKSPFKGLLPLFLALLATGWGYAVAVADLNAFYLGISLFACVFILLDFRTGVALLVVVMPVSASALFPHNFGGVIGLNPLNLLAVATLFSLFLQRTGGVGLLHLAPTPLRWWYAFPMVVGAVLGWPHIGEIPSDFYLAQVVSFASPLGYLCERLLKPSIMLLFALLVGAAVVRSRTSDIMLLPMLVSIWLMGLMTLVYVYLSGASLSELSSPASRSFFAPLGMHANDLGRCYAVAYALLLYSFAASQDYRMRAALAVSMGMVVMALMLTFSRGAFLGFFVVNLLFLVSRRRVGTLLLAAACFVGILLILPGAVFERITSGWGMGLNAISAGRVDELWLPLLPEIWNSPIYGQGLGSILWSNAARAGMIVQVAHPHNAYLQAILDVGFVGLLLLLAYFYHVWKGFRALSKDVSLSPPQRGFYEGAAVGLLSFLLAGFAGSSLMPVPEQCFLWLAIGMMYGVQAGQKEAAHGSKR